MNVIKKSFLTIALFGVTNQLLIATTTKTSSTRELKKEIRDLHQQIRELQYDLFRDLKTCSCQDLGNQSRDTSVKALKQHHAIAQEILQDLQKTEQKVKNLCHLCIA